ncbi:MAG: hypothetical protein U0556_20055 [Dehalococcoidia bacterium]
MVRSVLRTLTPAGLALALIAPTAFATELPPTNPPSVSLAQAAGTPCGPDQQAAGVYLYSEQSFGGKCAYFQIDLASANEWHIGNDQAQSVRIVGPNLTAILWKDVWFSGGGTLLTGPVEIPNLDSYPCDRTGCVSGKQASSLMVRFSQPDQPPPGVGLPVRGGDQRDDLSDPDGHHSACRPDVTISAVFLYTQPGLSGDCFRIDLTTPEATPRDAASWPIGTIRSLRCGLCRARASRSRCASSSTPAIAA